MFAKDESPCISQHDLSSNNASRISFDENIPYCQNYRDNQQDILTSIPQFTHSICKSLTKFVKVGSPFSFESSKESGKKKVVVENTVGSFCTQMESMVDDQNLRSIPLLENQTFSPNFASLNQRPQQHFAKPLQEVITLRQIQENYQIEPMRPFKQSKVQNIPKFREVNTSTTPNKENCHTEPSQSTSSRKGDSFLAETNQSSSSIIAFRPSYDETMSKVVQFKDTQMQSKRAELAKQMGKVQSFEYESRFSIDKKNNSQSPNQSIFDKLYQYGKQKLLNQKEKEQSLSQMEPSYSLTRNVSHDKGSQERVYKRLMEFQQKKEEKIQQQRRILEFQKELEYIEQSKQGKSLGGKTGEGGIKMMVARMQMDIEKRKHDKEVKMKIKEHQESKEMNSLFTPRINENSSKNNPNQAEEVAEKRRGVFTRLYLDGKRRDQSLAEKKVIKEAEEQEQVRNGQFRSKQSTSKGRAEIQVPATNNNSRNHSTERLSIQNENKKMSNQLSANNGKPSEDLQLKSALSHGMSALELWKIMGSQDESSITSAFEERGSIPNLKQRGQQEASQSQEEAHPEKEESTITGNTNSSQPDPRINEQSKSTYMKIQDYYKEETQDEKGHDSYKMLELEQQISKQRMSLRQQEQNGKRSSLYANHNKEAKRTIVEKKGSQASLQLSNRMKQNNQRISQYVEPSKNCLSPKSKLNQMSTQFASRRTQNIEERKQVKQEREKRFLIQSEADKFVNQVMKKYQSETNFSRKPANAPAINAGSRLGAKVLQIDKAGAGRNKGKML